MRFLMAERVPGRLQQKRRHKGAIYGISLGVVNFCDISYREPSMNRGIVDQVSLVPVAISTFFDHELLASRKAELIIPLTLEIVQRNDDLKRRRGRWRGVFLLEGRKSRGRRLLVIVRLRNL